VHGEGETGNRSRWTSPDNQTLRALKMRHVQSFCWTWTGIVDSLGTHSGVLSTLSGLALRLLSWMLSISTNTANAIAK
jgi:hypothetical protein